MHATLGKKRTSQIKSLFPFEFRISFASSYKGMRLYLIRGKRKDFIENEKGAFPVKNN